MGKRIKYYLYLMIECLMYPAIRLGSILDDFRFKIFMTRMSLYDLPEDK